jgi:hypothetical protein
VDGFRFDLATALTRDEKGHMLPAPPLIRQIAKDPVLSKVWVPAPRGSGLLCTLGTHTAYLSIWKLRLPAAPLAGAPPSLSLLDASAASRESTNWGRAAQVKLIAEPWDIGGYQVGSFPNWEKWGEWNGIFRDDIRWRRRAHPRSNMSCLGCSSWGLMRVALLASHEGVCALGLRSGLGWPGMRALMRRMSPCLF